MVDDPRITLNADGTIADANEAAVALYGASLGELRAAPAGTFAADPQPPEAQAALRQAWEAQGQPDLVGEATIRRQDGTVRRVSFGITALEDKFVAILRPIDEPTAAPTKVFTAGEVLAAWRAAERELRVIPPESDEASRVLGDIERFRQAYQQLFRTKQV